MRLTAYCMFAFIMSGAHLSCAPRQQIGSDAGPEAGRNYIRYVEKFADTLLEHGLDRYGAEYTPMWASIIEVDTLKVPYDAWSVPLPQGAREEDRAVGGSNLHHDVVTLRVFNKLGQITGRPKYEKAVRDYIRSYLKHCQNPETGLIAWGEHLYWDMFDDRVAIERRHHELVEWTPPWEELWGLDPEATLREIRGLKYHFKGENPDEHGWVFNRHGAWGSTVIRTEEGQPWAKHSALFSHAFMFLYSKTQDPEDLRWGRGSGSATGRARPCDIRGRS